MNSNEPGQAEEIRRLRDRITELERINKDKFFSVFEAIPAFVYLKDRTRTVVYANTIYKRLFGDPKGRRCHEIFYNSPKPCERCGLMKVFETRTPTIQEWTYPTGRTYLIQENYFEDVNGNPLVIEMGVDITERKLAEDALRENESGLKQALSVKDEFLSMVSHELRTPLVPILGYSELLKDGRLGDLGARAIAAINIIHSRAEALRIIIEDLLQLSSLDGNTVEIDLHTVNLKDFIPLLLEDYQSIKLPKPTAIRWQGENLLVTADPHRLLQILRNLIDNAIKYSKDSVDIVIRTSMGEGMGRITVEDSGIGIAPEYIPLIFERFYQIEAATTREHSGAGLGLSIVKKLVKLMGGDVSVESKPGGGSRFTVSFLLADSEIELAGDDSAKSESPKEPESIPPKRILVIDDDIFTLELVEDMIGREHEIVSARSGPEGLDLLRESDFDLVILDHMMSGMDGMAVLEEIKADKQIAGVPVVLFTGRVETESIRKAFSAGIDSLIEKPFSRIDIIRCLHGIFTDKKADRNQG